MTQQQFYYDVFISYRHKPLDGAVAQKSLNWLESFKLPRGLADGAGAGPRRVFRDTEELSVSGVLSDTIQKALLSTRVLVVVCSLDTPESEWVDREVATFIELGRADYVYALLIGGGPEDSFPPSLKRIPDIADRTLDARGGTKKQTLRLLDEALLPVAARCAGLAPARLEKAVRRGRGARMSLRFAGAFGLLALVAGVSLGLWALAAQYRNTAREEQAATMELISDLTYSLPARLSGLPGTYGRISAILTENVAQINDILEVSDDPRAVLAERAVNLEKLAAAQAVLGEGAQAVASSRQAVEIYRALAQEVGGPEREAAYASGLNNLANHLSDAGSYTEADELLAEAVQLQEALVAQLEGRAGHAGALYDLGLFYHNSGSNLFRMGDYRAATAMELKSEATLEALAGGGASAALRKSLMGVYTNLGANYTNLAEYADAVACSQKAHALAQALYDESPGRHTLADLAAASNSLALAYNRSGDRQNAETYYRQAVEQWQVLAEDKENQSAQASLASTYLNYGASLNHFGDYEGARQRYEEALALRLAQAETGAPLAQVTVARVYYNLAENELDAGSYAEAEAFYRQSLEHYRPVAEELGAYNQAEYLAFLSYYETVFTTRRQDALEHARAAVELMPDLSFTNYILGYALIFAGEEAEALEVLGMLAARGESERQTIREDFAMLRAKGLEHPTMALVENAF